MTHTLHRKLGECDLKRDFIVFSMSAKNINAEGSAEKMKKFFDIMKKYKSVNCGDMKTGNVMNQKDTEIRDGIKDTSIVHFVFDDPDEVNKIIFDLKAAKLGTSVVISGPVDEVDRMCQTAGIQVHTVEYSGGIFGRVNNLPSDKILCITTMCGHGMVAENLVKEMVRQVKSGKKSLDESAVELTKPCQCGVFNTTIAKKIIVDLMSDESFLLQQKEKA